MAEGIAVADGSILSGVHDDPESAPAPDASAPRGWTWNRKGKHWDPRQRGPVLYTPEAGVTAEPKAPNESQQPRDPDPRWMADDKPAAGEQGQLAFDFDEVPQDVKDDIAGLAGLIGTPILSILQRADPYCGGVLAQNFEPVVDAALPLICRSKRIVSYFTSDKSDWLMWGKLALALQPVGAAIVEHHVLRRVQVVRDDKGVAHIVRRAAGQEDHLTPEAQPEQELDYAA